MSKQSESQVSLESTDPTVSKPRLHKLIIKNFRAIGPTPVEIELDDIVVLVGPNNAGKSSILKAYQVIMSQGSNEGKLTIDDFPNGIINDNELPQIELQTIVYDNSPGEQWIDESAGEKKVRELWIWTSPGEPIRKGYNVETGEWDNHVPWGAPNVAKSKRPEPHRIDAFANPQEQSDEIIKILKQILKDKVKEMTTEVEGAEEDSEYKNLLDQLMSIQKMVIQESKSEIEQIETDLSSLMDKVFPGYTVKFDARPEDDLEKAITFFKSNPQLLMGPIDGYKGNIERQGSGARRTLLWTALRYISENGLNKNKKEKDVSKEKPHVLLMDEPELCLHPSAIREACNVLYELPQNNNWQVMLTTHSPAFIDLSRDNTTIIRVEREGEKISGTTLFRPERVQLDDNDRQRLKLLNQFDPYVAEFFFGGNSIVVEGDTEYTAFKYVISKNPDRFKNVHIIKARGKATIVSLVKILNHFNSRYSVLHDSDTMETKNGGKNPAWSTNVNILNAINKHHDRSKVRLVASLTNFEVAYLDEESEDDKPYHALIQLKEDDVAFKKIKQLLLSLINHEEGLPDGCIEWNDVTDLEELV